MKKIVKELKELVVAVILHLSKIAVKGLHQLIDKLDTGQPVEKKTPPPSRL